MATSSSSSYSSLSFIKKALQPDHMSMVLRSVQPQSEKTVGRSIFSPMIGSLQRDRQSQGLGGVRQMVSRSAVPASFFAAQPSIASAALRTTLHSNGYTVGSFIKSTGLELGRDIDQIFESPIEMGIHLGVYKSINMPVNSYQRGLVSRVLANAPGLILPFAIVRAVKNVSDEAKEEVANTLRSSGMQAGIGGLATQGLALGLLQPTDTMNKLVMARGKSVVEAWAMVKKHPWKGVSAGALKQLVGFGCAMTSKDNIDKVMRNKFPGNPVIAQVLSGMGAGVVQAVVTAPISAIDIQQTTSEGKPTSISQTAITMYREQGVRGFYRGTVAQAVRNGSWFAAYFAANQALTQFVQETNAGKGADDKENQPSTITALAIGAASGALGTLVSHPADAVSKRMKAGAGDGLYSTIKKLTVHNGAFNPFNLSQLYRGVGYNIARMGLFGVGLVAMRSFVASRMDFAADVISPAGK